MAEKREGEMKRALAISILGVAGVGVCWGLFFTAAFWGFDRERILLETFIGAVVFVLGVVGSLWAVETLERRQP